MNLSVYGATGFIGSQFVKQFRDSIIIPREQNESETPNILYFISTNNNYNVFENPHLDIDTNLTKLISVLEANRNKFGSNFTFNFISSWFVYGETELPATEKSICNPKGFYSITKKCAEDLLISYCKTYNINYRIFRLANVYGKDDKFSAKKNALQFLINKIKNNEDIDLYYGGEFYRDYIHVEDVCDILRFACVHNELSEIYNIGSNEKYLFIDLIFYIHGMTRSKSKIKTINAKDFHKIVQVKDFYMSSDKIYKHYNVSNKNIWNGLYELF